MANTDLATRHLRGSYGISKEIIPYLSDVYLKIPKGKKRAKSQMYRLLFRCSIAEQMNWESTCIEPRSVCVSRLCICRRRGYVKTAITEETFCEIAYGILLTHSIFRTPFQTLL